MTLNLWRVCEFFERLALICAKREDTVNATVRSWFRRHDDAIPRHGSQALTLLSCLLPTRRADQVYDVQEHRLRTSIQNAHGLDKSRKQELRRWQDIHGLGFACAAAQTLSASVTLLSSSTRIEIEDVEHVLSQMASTCVFSSLEIRRYRKDEPSNTTSELTRLFRKADSLQVKWLARLIQKDLRPTAVAEMVVLRCFHFLLSACLAVRSSLQHALQLLDELAFRHIPSYPLQNIENELIHSTFIELQPQLGVMVSLPRSHALKRLEAFATAASWSESRT